RVYAAHKRIACGLALWNGRDETIKERLFGLSGPQGNHGEDVKEYYFYLDSADARLHEGALQVSAGGVSLRGAESGNGAARPRRSGVRAARHRGLRRGPPLLPPRRIRQRFPTRD